ncbi:MAG: 50S ribosomal protein L9 [Rikenellaceae bacterium]|nr:50S ribosomal protein L9 [Rikenellaceae bacterium]
MQIILKKDVENLGYANDIVDVRPGYANNFLIPQGYATVATPSAKKVLAENLRQRAHKDAKVKSDAEQLAASFEGVSVTIPAKVGEQGKIFGSVSAAQVADALKEKGFDIYRKNISVETIKALGSYTATIRLHKEVSAQVAVEVVEEK